MARIVTSSIYHLRKPDAAKFTLLAADPYHQSPPYEAPVGDLRGASFNRINTQHRLLLSVLEVPRIVKVLRMCVVTTRSMRSYPRVGVPMAGAAAYIVGDVDGRGWLPVPWRRWPPLPD